MTTPNVNAPGMIPAGAQEITSNKAKGENKDGQSFMDVMSIADSASKIKTPEQSIPAAKDQSKAPKEVKEAGQKNKSDDVKKDTSKQDGKEVKDTAKTDKNAKTETKDDKVKTDTKVEKAAEKIKDSIKDELDITDEELNQIMETLGLTNAELFDPKAITDIVAEVKDVTPVDIVSDSELSGIVTKLQGSVRDITSDLIQEMDITPEEFKNTLNELKNEYEVVTPGAEEDTQDPKNMGEDRITRRNTFEAVRTPAEAVEEAPTDRTGRISEERKGDEEVNLNVTVRDNTQDQSSANSNDTETGPDGFLRSEDRGRRTESPATNTENNNIFFQNLTDAVENTLDAIAQTEPQSSASAMVDAMDLINQIQSQIRAVVDSESQTLAMQLHPQSLGRLNVELVSRSGQLTAQFEAENASVKAALETHLVELKESLEQRGVRVESVEVTVASHEFEQNLMGGEQSGNASQGSEGRPRARTRSINLNDPGIDGIDGEDIDEGERIARDMMAADGNSVDYMA